MSDFMSELRSFMDEVETKELNIVQEDTFKITSRDQANYFVRKIMDLKAQETEVVNSAKDEIERLTSIIKIWEEKELDTIHKAMEYFNGLLREFAESELDGTKKRSIKLPFGTLQFRSQQPKFVYDDDSLKAYLQSHAEDLVEEKVEYKVNKTELKKRATVVDGKLMLDGEVVEGVYIETLDDKFEVK